MTKATLIEIGKSALLLLFAFVMLVDVTQLFPASPKNTETKVLAANDKKITPRKKPTATPQKSTITIWPTWTPAPIPAQSTSVSQTPAIESNNTSNMQNTNESQGVSATPAPTSNPTPQTYAPQGQANTISRGEDTPKEQNESTGRGGLLNNIRESLQQPLNNLPL